MKNRFVYMIAALLFAATPIAHAEQAEQSGQAPAFDLSMMTLKVEVEEGITAEEVDESIKSLATSEGIFYVFYAPLYKQIEAITGKPFRHLSIHMLCDAVIGGQMVDYENMLSTMMPCRISVVEDKNGKIALYTTNPDLFIADPNMPENLRPLAEKVASQIKNIMHGAAAGEF